MPELKPGDVLLYTGKGIIGRLIRLKTWSRFSHCEVYDGDGMSLASRDGLGVERYPLRTEGLAAVLHLRYPFECEFDIHKARRWFETVRKQGYDFLGLMCFFLARKTGAENRRMFCSEFVTRYFRNGGVDPFNQFDADGIAPGEFVKTPTFEIVWKAY